MKLTTYASVADRYHTESTVKASMEFHNDVAVIDRFELVALLNFMDGADSMKFEFKGNSLIMTPLFNKMGKVGRK